MSTRNIIAALQTCVSMRVTPTQSMGGWMPSPLWTHYWGGTLTALCQRLWRVRYEHS